MMKWRPLVVILVFSTLSVSQETTYSRVGGVVRDATGGVIENADVVVHWNCPLPEGPQAPKMTDMATETDELGRFSVAVLPGFYDVCVHATAFSPRCTTVKAAKGKAVVYNPRLSVNALITSETADTFLPAKSKKSKK